MLYYIYIKAGQVQKYSQIEIRVKNGNHDCI